MRIRNSDGENSPAARRASRVGTSSPPGSISVGPFSLPMGKSTVIMFSVMVNSPLPNAVCSVSNQGQVTSTQVASTMTDDPDVAGTANPTLTPGVTPPTITCNADITTNTDQGVCTATRPFAITATGCPTPTITCTIPGPTTIGSTTGYTLNGSYGFPKGTTTGTCTAANGQSPNASCMFAVTVNDMQPPTITCPAPVSHSTDPNLCTAVVTYAAPTVGDNCPGVGTPSCIPASGSTFNKGVTTVTCSVMDASSNSNTCMFTVTVNDNQAPVVTCPASGGAFAASDCLPSQRSAYTGATLYSVGANVVTN